MSSVGQLLMSSSNTTESASIVTRHPMPAVVSPNVVPHPQAWPGLVTDNTVASAVQFARCDVGCGGDGVLGTLAAAGAVGTSWPRSQPARNGRNTRTTDATKGNLMLRLNSGLGRFFDSKLVHSLRKQDDSIHATRTPCEHLPFNAQNGERPSRPNERFRTQWTAKLVPRHLRSTHQRVLSSRQYDPVILRRARRAGDQIASTAGPRRTSCVQLVYAIVERAVERHQRHARWAD